jgi:Asp-tRNA(Asn)/Glu-tRNA(Gln) amidotransferase A subunit family amidase
MRCEGFKEQIQEMRIYIAGKISGLPPEEAKAAFEKAAALLKQHGHEPVNPIEANGLDGDGVEHPWADYMKRDIPLLLACDGICLLDNWRDSKGARLEHEIAAELGMHIISVAWFR